MYVKIYCNYRLNRAARAVYSISSGQEERSNGETSKEKWGGGKGGKGGKGGQRYFRDPVVRMRRERGASVNRDWGAFCET